MFESLDRRGEIAVGPLRQTDQPEQGVGDSAAGRQHNGLARIRARFDDGGDAPETLGVSDARAAKFLYYPFAHANSTVGFASNLKWLCRISAARCAACGTVGPPHCAGAQAAPRQ